MLTLPDDRTWGADTVPVPPAFWSRPDVRQALEDLDLGAVLALVERHTGLSQADMVRLTGMSASEVSRHINGRRRTRNIEIIRDALDGLGLPSAAERVDAIAARSPQAEAGESGLLESLARGSAGLLLQVERDAVGDWSAAAVDAYLRGAAARYLTVPIGETLSDLVRIEDHVTAWRIRNPSPARAREVWALAGWHTALAGWVSVDQGRPDQAAVHARAAQACAEYSGHEGVAAWAAVLRRTIAYWEARRRDGVRYAATGLEAAQRVGGGALLITLSALAQDHAHLGEEDAALDLLAQARRVLHAEATQDSDLAGPLACGPSRAFGYHVETLLDLDRPAEAVRVADEGLEVAADVMVRNPGSERMLALHRALGLARLGRAEEAMAAVALVLETPAEQRATPLKLRLRQVVRALPSGAETDTLRERTAAFVRTT
ncbi:helix-turn-helix domain-containing protein [Nocardiopsis changdeensis]|uniref:Helix-turn-helix domain-containing protein n=1 Tax=Nocardiopsis changdeensis TaxID=2831969 RepID=A0A975KT26_9ACTN|nr:MULTISPECIES: helix-turn-helix transcriptional regulator [Nocardiopsis]QUX26480.1 helix-turn-helix domain-containing protein [Nocardiopsis changdeensis]QYX40752.1 helix-turn-helix domain-containing protein [Nocardiopsis sp. MT53]